MGCRERECHARGVCVPDTAQDTSRMFEIRRSRQQNHSNMKYGRMERGHEGEKSENETKLALRTD